MEKLILIIEDEAALSGALRTKLEHLGAKVMIAKDGQEGLKTALSAQPDLILLDLLMPKMDGMLLLEKLREDSWGKSAKVVVVTNLSVTGREEQARELGVLDFIVKTNMSLSEITDRVQKLLE